MSKRRVATIALGGLLGLCSPAGDVGFAAQTDTRFEIEATYGVELAAFDLGDFHLTAELDGGAYKLKAQGRFSFISGMIYRASGRTESAGRLSKEGAEPSQFMVTYKVGSKREERRLSFVNGSVKQVSIDPPKKPNKRNVPVTPDQLEHVLDPLTAAFVAARSNGSDGDLGACQRTVPVFDGKQRYDIILSPMRSERLGEDATGGLSGSLAVCRVKFVPIGGHRVDHPGTKFMSKTNGIEVWLASLPGTFLYIPYRIVVPTAWGTGSISLKEIKLHH